MKRPAYLEKGDKVYLVAPSARIAKDSLLYTEKVFQSWGLEVIKSPYLFEEYYQFAGTIKQRREALQIALDQTEAKAIVCVRGGYGMLQIIDDLDFTNFKKSPKWVVGFSDISVLLNNINNLSIECIHGAMPVVFERNSTQTLETLKNALFGKELFYRVEPHPFNCLGEAYAEVTGGNLCLLHNLTGTCTDIETDNKILFLEDVGEPLYNIERMMLHLDRAGKLKNLVGMIIGQFSKIKPENPPFDRNTEEIIRDIVEKYQFPVCYNFPVGHEEDNWTMICGRKARLSITKETVELRFDN